LPTAGGAGHDAYFLFQRMQLEHSGEEAGKTCD
jgi:hypothetical protein